MESRIIGTVRIRQKGAGRKRKFLLFKGKKGKTGIKRLKRKYNERKRQEGSVHNR